MPLVEISLWPGRGPDVKARIIREVTEVVARTTGAPPEAVEVMQRIARENGGEYKFVNVE